ncbi:MAG: MFS transporter [Bryobacterales bacterium]|nr:MFS transporter [Bryobacterales bacterium]
MKPVSARWFALGVFTLYTTLNYLDRQTLAALTPQLRGEFRLTNEDIGWLHSAFYAVYALCAPFAGWWIDRVGLTMGASATIVLWSLAAMATGWVESYEGLVVCRLLLGAAEAGGIPAFGKAAAMYLPPSERALGLGVNQLGLSGGSMLAPLLAGWVAAMYGWRAAFVAVGAAGFFWAPLWRVAQRRATPLDAVGRGRAAARPGEMIRDARLWGLIAANVLVMTVYSLWTNWTTVFLVQRYGLSQWEANQQYAWIPPLCAAGGGIVGGWLSMRWIRAGQGVYAARGRVILWGAAAVLLTIAVPYMPGPGWATAMVSLSFFSSVAVSANLYALPHDLFGAERTAFAVSGITSGYGLMLVFYSPWVGRLVDQYGFLPVCRISAFLPLLGWLVLRLTTLRRAEAA